MSAKNAALALFVLATSCLASSEDRAAEPERHERAPSEPAPLKAGEERAPATARFDDGERAFRAAKDALLKRYVKAGLSEDDAYRAATQGLLEHIDPDPALRAWNKLLTPAELAAMRGDLRGEIVGVGLEIKFDSETGYADVLTVMPRSAAERAGIARGDKIVAVDGRFFRGASEAEVVGHIRGRAGEAVKLTVLHEDKLSTLDVAREVLSIEPVTRFSLADGVGYLRVRGFSAKTADATRAALRDLEKDGARALVLDLRQNQGGSFDEALAVAGAFLPEGTPVATVKRRGDHEETATSRGAPVLAGVPLAVLCDGGTSSGAELLAAALRDARKAALLGSRSFGKWSVQTLDELQNGYALKYTIALFKTPAGKSWDGVGLTPDIEIDMTEKQTVAAQAVTDPARRLEIDPQLRTAAAYLRRP